MTVMAPKNGRELTDMLHFAFQFPGPIAIRYPRGAAYQGFSDKEARVELGCAETLIEGKGQSKIALLALGSMVSTGAHIVEKMEKKGVSLSLVNARFAKPIDEKLLDRLSEEGYRKILTLEEGVLSGGFGEAVLRYMALHHQGVFVENVTLPDCYVEHGDVSALRKMLKMDSDSIIERLEEEGFFD